MNGDLIATLVLLALAGVFYLLGRRASTASKQTTLQDASFSGIIRVTTERGKSLSVTEAIRQIPGIKLFDVCNVDHSEVIVQRTFPNETVLIEALTQIQNLRDVVVIQTDGLRPKYVWKPPRRTVYKSFAD